LKPHFLSRDEFGQTLINLQGTVRGLLQP
jgi:hypothetical protein